MPGTPKGARLSMRFRVQYRDGRGDWKDVEDADSGWRQRRRREGRPRSSTAGASRSRTRTEDRRCCAASCKFRWRRGDTLPRTAEVATESGHRSSAGADPAGYSAATCALGS